MASPAIIQEEPSLSHPPTDAAVSRKEEKKAFSEHEVTTTDDRADGDVMLRLTLTASSPSKPSDIPPEVSVEPTTPPRQLMDDVTLVASGDDCITITAATVPDSSCAATDGTSIVTTTTTATATSPICKAAHVTGSVIEPWIPVPPSEYSASTSNSVDARCPRTLLSGERPSSFMSSSYHSAAPPNNINISASLSSVSFMATSSHSFPASPTASSIEPRFPTTHRMEYPPSLRSASTRSDVDSVMGSPMPTPKGVGARPSSIDTIVPLALAPVVQRTEQPRSSASTATSMVSAPSPAPSTLSTATSSRLEHSLALTASFRFMSAQQPAKYKKLHLLGEGACGVVYAVQRQSDLALFAAKIVHLKNSSERRFQRAMDEPRLMARCNSPFVVRFVDERTDVPKRVIILVMELIDGVDMCRHIRTFDQRRSFHLLQVRRLARGLPEQPPSSVAPTTASSSSSSPVALAPATETQDGGGISSIVPISALRMKQLERRANPEMRFHLQAARMVTITEDAALMLFAQIALGVHHLHEKNIVHCDLTAGNVFLCRTGLVKIGDLGLSRSAHVGARGGSTSPRPPLATNSTTSKGAAQNGGQPFLHATAVGTPCYMAPELWCTDGPPEYSDKSDMWALGVLLFELLTSRRPFYRLSTPETGAAVLSGAVPDILGYAPDTSARMVHLVQALLAPVPKDRPSTTDVLKTPIMQHALTMLVTLLKDDANISPDVAAWTVDVIRRLDGGADGTDDDDDNATLDHRLGDDDVDNANVVQRNCEKEGEERMAPGDRDH